MNIEREIKLELTEDDYLRMRDFLKKNYKTSFVYQHNEIFNLFNITKGVIPWALRIRKETEDDIVNYIISAKGSARKKTEYASRIEIEEVLNDSNSILNKNVLFRVFLSKHGIISEKEKMEYFVKTAGKFLNERLIACTNEKGIKEIDLDKTIFPDNQIDFELEIEFSESKYYIEIDKFLKKIFKELDIIYKVQSRSKRARLMDHLK
ncbi:MAG: hypothetical protein JXA60_07275 [Candidatus Coatesbacteria bacterium]|nr:hypothetical protein [Candidatus Coatesbacteria bacterium]